MHRKSAVGTYARSKVINRGLLGHYQLGTVQPGIELVSLTALDDLQQCGSRCGCGYADRASPYPGWKNNASRSVVY